MEMSQDEEFDIQMNKKEFSNYELLDGMYTPIRIYKALLYFVNNAQMNISHNDKIINILDFFPMLKQGYCLRNTLTTLMFSYCNINGLLIDNNVKTDNLMNKAFNSDIPSHFIPGRKLMTEAVNEGLVGYSLNTFNTVKMSRTEFNPELFPNSYFQTISVLNYDIYDLELIKLVKDKNFMNKLINEYRLFKEILKITKSASDNQLKDCKPLKIDLTEILNIMMFNKFDQ